MTFGASGLASVVSRVQQLPYAWPGPPTSLSARQTGRGTCAAKHALLREDLEAVGLVCAPLLVVEALVPGLWPDLQEAGRDLLEVHDCLTVVTPWAGPLLVDITWHPAAVRAGLRGRWPGTEPAT